MSESKTKKASKTTAKNGKATVQLDFLPAPSPVPANLAGSTDDSRVVDGQAYVRVDRIVNPPDPAMNRYTPEEWVAQMQSFRALGIKTAIHVRPVAGGFWLEDGRHRVLAAQELGLEYVKADIDANGSAASSAVWRFAANAMRKGDRPIDQAIAWNEMMDPEGAALNQAQVSAAVGVSQATISRRLRLLALPRELAVLVGQGVAEKDLEALFDVREHKEVFEAGATALLKQISKGQAFESAHKVFNALVKAWTTSPSGKAPDLDDPALLVQESGIHHRIVADPAFKKARRDFQAIEVQSPGRWEGDKPRKVVFYRNVAKVIETGQAIVERLNEEQRLADEREAAKAKKAGKRLKTVKDPQTGQTKTVVVKAKTVEERTPQQAVGVQLALMAKHVPAQVSTPDEVVAECLARFVEHTRGAIATAEDRAAACQALGLAVPEPDENTGRAGSLYLTREAFLQRWAKDRPAAMQMARVALFFQARDFYKQVKDQIGDGEEAIQSLVPVWTTGTTYAEACAVAAQQVRDRDAGFKPVADGSTCDHCDEPARLKKAGVKVCKSEAFDTVDPQALASIRLRRAAQRKAPQATAEGPPAPRPSDEAPAAADKPANGHARKAKAASKATSKPAKAKAKAKPAAAA